MKLDEESERKQLQGGATVLLVQMNQISRESTQLQIVSLGDSICLMVRKDYQFEILNEIHDLKNAEEIKRIESLGGFILKN